MPASKPFPQDPVTRIVNVRWPTGIFVVKATDGHLFIRKSSGKWTDVGVKFDSTVLLANSGSSYALIEDAGSKDKKKPVFVVSGRFSDEDKPEGYTTDGGFIAASSDGLEWTKVFSQREADPDLIVGEPPDFVPKGHKVDPWVFQPTGIVWDPTKSAFFAAFWVATLTRVELGDGAFEINETSGERIYKSSDGRSWSLDIDHVIYSGEVPDDAVSVLVPFCTKRENKGGFPDGLQAYDAITETFIKPTSLTKFSIDIGAVYAPSDPAASVDITTIGKGGEETSTVSVGTPCYAVGHRGGTWVAVGGSSSAMASVSSNGGSTWKLAVLGGDHHAATVSAGLNARL